MCLLHGQAGSLPLSALGSTPTLRGSDFTGAWGPDESAGLTHVGDCGCDPPVIPRSNFRIGARQCVFPFLKCVVEDNKHNRRK